MFVHTPQSDKSALDKVSKLLVGLNPASAVSYVVSEANWMPKGWKLTFEGVPSIEAAEGLRGLSVFISREDIAAPGENEYLVQDLIGCEVIDRVKGKVGILDSIEPASMGADRWWIKVPDGDTVPVPAVRRFILSVDTAKRQIVIVDFDQLT